MFKGAHNVSLDAKGRMAIPTKYRESLNELCSGRVVLTTDPEKCLLLYAEPEWEDFQHRLMKTPNAKKSIRQLQRFYIGNAAECDMDGNGRILVPQTLRAFANIDKRAVLSGVSNKFEIWNEDAWNQQLMDVPEIPEDLGDLFI